MKRNGAFLSAIQCFPEHEIFIIPSDVFQNKVINKKTTLGYCLDEIKFETPVQLGSGIHNIGMMGAFSYYGDSIDARFCDSIGRFCIIGNNVLIGHHDHCHQSLTAHPMFVWPESRFSGYYNPNDEICKKNNGFHNTYFKNNSNGKITIGNDVWIGDNVIILNGVHIADGAVIGSGSVVTSDVEPYTIVSGNPAKPVKKRFTDDQIKELLNIKWWDYGPEILADVYLGDIDSAIKTLKEKIEKGFPKYKSSVWTLNTVTGILRTDE